LGFFARSCGGIVLTLAALWDNTAPALWGLLSRDQSGAPRTAHSTPHRSRAAIEVREATTYPLVPKEERMRRLVLPAAALSLILLALTAPMVRAEIPATTASAFQPSTQLAAGFSPWSIAAADVDGDGHVDLAVANNEPPDEVSVLFGVGDGTFEPAMNLPAAAGPSGVQVVDTNGDGLLDIVVAHNVASVVLTFVQGPARTFTAAQDAATGEGPEGIAVGDLNRDGNADVAAANFFEVIGTVSVRFGRGDGTFYAGVCDDATLCDLDGDCSAGTCAPLDIETVPGSSELFTGPVAVAIADVNKDSKRDLVVANNDGGNVAVIAGNGDGTFAEPVNFDVGTGPVSIAVADLNIDGNPDIVTADEEEFTVSYLAGNGDGTFAGVVGLSVGSFPEALAVWDFNLDGRPDVAVANTLTEADAVSILRGNGDGSFQPIEDFVLGGSAILSPFSIATGDFNGDQRRDMATANLDAEESEAVSVLLNGGALTIGDANTDGGVNGEDVEGALAELFDGDGDSVITVAGGTTEGGPGVDGNGDDQVSAADIVAIIGLVANGQG
jgi:hypothetical protein